MRTVMDPASTGGKHSVKWSEGDCLNINGLTSAPLGPESDGKTIASFTFGSLIEKPYNTIYPASAYVSDGVVRLDPVQRESPVPGSFGQGADLLVGLSDRDGDIALHHTCAAVKLNIRLKNDSDSLAYVEFRGNDFEQVSGTFNLDISNAAISGTSTSPEDLKVRAMCCSPATAEGTPVVIMVPAGTYPQGFTVTVVDNRAHAMEKTTTSAKTLTAGTLTVMPAFDFVPDKTVFDVVIGSASDLVTFASDWNSGKYAGKGRLSITMAGDIAFDSSRSSSFAATGGIGNEKYPFDGEFNAAGHRISSLTSSVPVFSRISAEGAVRNLTISSSCSFSGTSVLAGELQGTLEGCTVSSSLNHSDNLSADCLVGAIARTAAAGSLISACTNEGDIVIKSTAKALSKANLYVGGITADCAGTISGCTNRGKVEAVLNYACKDVRLAGIAACTSGPAATFEECSNSGAVHLDGTAVSGEVSSDRSKNTEACLGGMVARTEEKLTLRRCTNSGEINYDFSTSTKINQRPSCVGGIAGWLGGDDSTITGCVNSGKLCNYNFNNSSTVELCPSEGGVVAVCLGKGSVISGCSSLGENTMQIQRGVQGGIAGWIESGSISSCESEVKTVDCPGNIPIRQGGIAGSCAGSTISSCKVSGAYLCCKTSATTSAGCIAGNIDGTSRIIGCTIINGRLARNGSDNFTAGAVAGKIEASSAEITGCKINAYRSVDSGSTWTEFTLSGVSGSGAFTQGTTPNTLEGVSYNIAGHVRCGGLPLEGVVVSDGFQSAKTDANGFFSFNSNLSKVHVVSVCVPSGYAAPTVNGLPKFYTLVNGTPTTNISFSLEKIDGNPDNYTMIFSADPQPRSSAAGYDKIAYHSLDCAKDAYRDIGSTADGISGEKVYGVVLGDVVHENMSLYDTHCNNLGTYCSNMSTYHVIGNHDYNKTAADMAAGAVDFENHFGPTRYSMNLGKFHYVVLDDLIMNYSGGQLKDYTNGLSDDVYKWLVNDLKWVDSSTPIIICTHGPMYAKHNGGTSRSYIHHSAVNGENYAKLLARFSKVYAFAGHIHNNFTFIFSSEKSDEEYCSKVECYTIARSSGALWLNEYLNSDGSPRGYLVMKARGGQLSWKFTPVVHQSGSFAASYAMPSYSFRDWSYSGGVAKIGSAVLADDYQMKVYPDIAFNNSRYIMANVFFWDALWKSPTLRYTTDSGATKTVTLNRWGISSKPYDFAYYDLSKYYFEKNSNWRYEHTESDGSLSEPSICPHMFRCSVPSDGHKGRIEVTDRFGNTFQSKEITW